MLEAESLEPPRRAQSRRHGRLLLLSLLSAGVTVGALSWVGDIRSSQPYKACVLDTETTGSSASAVDGTLRRNNLTIQPFDSPKTQIMSSTGENALRVANWVSRGDEITYTITVEFNSFLALMTPAAGREYADRRVEEISRAAVIHLDPPSEVRIGSVNHGCILPTPPTHL